MTERTCIECGTSIAGLHFNRKTCVACGTLRKQRLERANKGITLLPDAPTCPVCKMRMNVITAGHYKKHGFNTAAAFKKAHGLTTLSAPSICARQSSHMHHRNPTKGRKRTAEERKKMSSARQGGGVGVAGKYERTLEIRNKISKGVTAHHLSNKGKFNHGAFHYSEKAGKDLFLRSTWEVRVLAVLEKHPCVETLETEPFVIPYMLGGQQRRYIPDFLITLEGGIREVWEVKPQWCWEHPKNQAKFKALNSYVDQQGWNARIVDLEALEGMERQVGILPWEGEGGPWVDPNNPDYRPTSLASQKGLA